MPAQGDADILYAMMIVNMQIPTRLDIEIEGTVTRNLFKHVFEERNSGIETGLSTSVEIERDGDLGFQRIATDFCTSIWHLWPIRTGSRGCR